MLPYKPLNIAITRLEPKTVPHWLSITAKRRTFTLNGRFRSTTIPNAFLTEFAHWKNATSGDGFMHRLTEA